MLTATVFTIIWTSSTINLTIQDYILKKLQAAFQTFPNSIARHDGSYYFNFVFVYNSYGLPWVQVGLYRQSHQKQFRTLHLRRCSMLETFDSYKKYQLFQFTLSFTIKQITFIFIHLQRFLIFHEHKQSLPLIKFDGQQGAGLIRRYLVEDFSFQGIAINLKRIKMSLEHDF